MCETIKIDLFDVFTSGGKTRTEYVEYQEPSYNLTGVSYQVIEADKIELIFKSEEVGKVHLTGSFRVVLEIPCDRCLKPLRKEINCEFDQWLFSEMYKSKLGDEDAEADCFLQGSEFDVYEFVNLCVLMNMPSKVLCKDDCKGLCPVCGQDKNENDCGCDSFVPDPRMAAIADIFYASKKEV